MLELIGGLRAAVIAAADVIVAREKDGSFLERALRDALASLLPGARIEQRLTLAAWTGRLGGVDVVYRPSAAHPRVGIETKVWDVADSLFDVLKLAAATQNGDLGAGYAVVAGRASDWQSPSAIRDMSTAAADTVRAWETSGLLRAEAPRWSRTWARSSARPVALPARWPPSPSPCHTSRATRSASPAFRPPAPTSSPSARTGKSAGLDTGRRNRDQLAAREAHDIGGPSAEAAQ
jgi:hypothetical protein